MNMIFEIFEIVATSPAQEEDAGWYYEVVGQEPQGPFPTRLYAEAAVKWALVA